MFFQANILFYFIFDTILTPCLNTIGIGYLFQNFKPFLMELNLVISFDDTGSMSSVRREVRRKIATLVDELFGIYENLKIGILIHNDYCDVDTLQKMDLTNQHADIIDFLNRESSCGGGDDAECYALALHEFRNFSWTSTNRVAILLGDAPPHEKGYKYETKEELYDWREETTLAKAEGIRIYPIQALGHRSSTFFYQTVAALSGTIKLDLSQFAHVTQYIVAITYQAADRLDEYENSQDAFKTNLMFKNMFAQLRGETPAELAPEEPIAVTAPILKIHPADNLIVALQTLRKGTSLTIDNQLITLITDVAAKHKFAAEALEMGDEIIMYGNLMGKAIRPIQQGEVIHVNNVRHDALGFTTKEQDYYWSPPDVLAFSDKTFEGYHRADGQVGTMNIWLIIPLVFCENRNVTVIHEALIKELGYSKENDYQALVRHLKNKTIDEPSLKAVAPSLSLYQNRHFKNMDGIKVLTHQGGCGGIRQDSETLCGLLAGYVHHPNCAGATILSLGCQNAQMEIFTQELKKRNPNFNKPLVLLDQQKCGTEAHLLSEAIRQTYQGLEIANQIERKPAPLSKLNIGVKCGGSDGFSGISANPAMGHTADLLSALGGSVVLAEFPELCGQEQTLLNRCINKTIADKFATLQRTYAQRAAAVGSGFDMNPSPGNIKDGLITDAMKSAGAAKKGGTSPVNDVLDYPEWVQKSGLNLLCTPGNDVECTTAMTAAGTNLILFSTGLGTPTGNPLCPVIKVSTNTNLAKHMADIIDIDTGKIITGEKTIPEMGNAILDFCIEIASGRTIPKAVLLEQDDFIPWKRGVSL